ncbi:TonB-dependent receptor plug domain-containing protein [Snodgrassella sp. CFCC 13594]|uniref:TonB-dependent receptor plug domain-containing protein n=1 Tax=Snodgrassella sp. CFCC 13594 TaxID=1775559 RepID=UPI000830F4C5|nr:TonB-dependent receptor plug domain-containing protein [Snodgrassella sp. CFCC 13594]
MRYTPKSLALAIALIGLPAAVWAEDSAQLPTVTVEGDQTSNQGVFQTTQVTAADIQKSNAVDLKSALKDVPGVEVLGVQGTRQGNDSINIRGLNGNRVGMAIDGIDLPETNESRYLSGQSVIFGRGGFIDTSSLRAIDIDKNARGNGLGGSVEMVTLSQMMCWQVASKVAILKALTIV